MSLRSASRLTLLLILLAPAAGPPAAGAEPVRMVNLDWEAAQVTQELLKWVLEERFGLEVVFVPGAEIELLQPLDAGEADIVPEIWLPNMDGEFARYVDPGSKESVLVNDRPYYGTQGFYVPGYVADEYGLRSVADLDDPKVAVLFDRNGDGRGDYWAGENGWSSTPIFQVKAKSYGFGRYFDADTMSNSEFRKTLRAAYRDRQPLLFFSWTPESMHATFDLRQLEEPRFDGYAMPSRKGAADYNADGCWNMITPEEDPENWLARSTVRCVYPDSTVYVAYSKSFAERHPRAGRFLKQVAFDGEMISSWTLLTGDYGMSAEEMIRIWVDENPETVEGWLAGL